MEWFSERFLYKVCSAWTSLAELAELMMLIGFDIGKIEYAAFLKCFFVNFFSSDPLT